MKKGLLLLLCSLSLVACEPSAASAYRQGTAKAVPVDYGMDLGELRHYSQFDIVYLDRYREQFDDLHVGSVREETAMRLVRFEQAPHLRLSDELKELDRRGLRPATLRELLSFGASYPDAVAAVKIHDDGSIAAYGSVATDYLEGRQVSVVPVVETWPGDRHGKETWTELKVCFTYGADIGCTYPGCLFLAVAKKK